MRIDPEEFDKQIAYVKMLADRALDALEAYRKDLIDYKWGNCASANRSKFQRLRIELAKEMLATEKYIYTGVKDGNI